VRLGIFSGDVGAGRLARINVRVRYEGEHRAVAGNSYVYPIPSIFKEEDGAPCRQEPFPRDLVSRDRNGPRTRAPRVQSRLSDDRTRIESASRAERGECGPSWSPGFAGGDAARALIAARARREKSKGRVSRVTGAGRNWGTNCIDPVRHPACTDAARIRAPRVVALLVN
jgi:hypothetical protein